MRVLAPARSIHRAVRRAACAARLVAALAAVVVSAALPARADAQRECYYGTLADYMALDAEGCRVGNLVFGDFGGFSNNIDLDRVLLVPFYDPSGENFGGLAGFFVYADPALSVSSAGTLAGEMTERYEGFQLEFRPLNLVGGSYAIAPPPMFSVQQAQSTAGWFASSFASMNDIYLERFSVDGVARDICAAPGRLLDCGAEVLAAPWTGGWLSTSLHVGVRAIAPHADGRSASATASMFIVGVVGATVTPEPATWAMVGSGLLGLAAVARRRRR